MRTYNTVTTTTNNNNNSYPLNLLPHPRRHHVKGKKGASAHVLTLSRPQKTFTMASKVGDEDQTRKASPPPAATAQPGERRLSASKATDPVADKREASDKSSNEAPLSHDDSAPPLPDEPVPDAKNNGWERRWDPYSQAYYYFNCFSGISQWECPRELEATAYPHGSYDRFANYHLLLLSSPA